MFVIVFYVPVEFCEKVKQAMFSVGAGSLGNYDQCSWQVLGEGQFRPKFGSNPTQGEINSLSQVQEYRVEMLCKGEFLEKAIQAMKVSHPYEEIAYHTLKHSEKNNTNA